MSETSGAQPAPLQVGRLPDFALWDKLKARGAPLSFDLELTARCNNDCGHCYINLPAGDRQARARELSPAEIEDIAKEAARLGAVWCLLTGGEPLLRDDFADVYMSLKRLGLLISVFTNACLVDDRHVDLFRRYPPRDIEVTVYGATRQTYELVTRRPGSFDAFSRGLDRLLNAGIRVRLKAMALRSNLHELADIAAFCRARTKDFYRFDPQLHLRFDGDEARNELIRGERLSPEEIVAVERADDERFGALQRNCDKLVADDCQEATCDHLFHCGAGSGSFAVAYDGTFRLCSSLWHPACTVNLRDVPLERAWRDLVPRVRAMRSQDERFLAHCRRCGIVNLCMWCPAHAHLETGSGAAGRMDAVPDYFCRVARARAASITQSR